MLARTLESILAGEAAKTDLAQRMPDDLLLRFESLRGYRLLPSGRTKNVTHLSLTQIAAAMLATATVKSGFAGLAATILSSLRPVGGIEVSFQGCETLGGVIERLLENPTACSSLLEVRVSDSEIRTNAHGRTSVTYTDGGEIKTTHVVGRNAISSLQPRADKTFNPRGSISSVVTEMIFYPPLFRRIADRLERERRTPPMPVAVDPRDEEEENPEGGAGQAPQSSAELKVFEYPRRQPSHLAARGNGLRVRRLPADYDAERREQHDLHSYRSRRPAHRYGESRCAHQSLSQSPDLVRRPICHHAGRRGRKSGPGAGARTETRLYDRQQLVIRSQNSGFSRGAEGARDLP